MIEAVKARLRIGSNQQGFDRRLIAPMILGAILNPINSSILAVSLIPIGAAFGAPPSQTAWLVSALYLATSIGQPVVGRLVDVYGPRRLFLTGTALTGIAGVLGTLAVNLWMLVAARVILGFGTCAGYPAAMYLIRYENRVSGRDSPAGVLTALAVSSQTIAVIGPTLGGLLIGLGGWRTTLAINIPLAIVGYLLGLRRLPRDTGVEGAGRPATGLDLTGVALFAAMLTSTLLLLMSPRPGRLWLLAIAAASALLLVRRERRVAAPFIDVRVLAGNGPLILTYLRMLLAQLVSYAFLYGYTQWLEDGRGLNASQAGLALLPMFAIGIVVSTTTGRHPHIRGKLVVGAITQVAACALLLIISAGSGIWLLILFAVILGVPQGLNSLANQNAVYYQAEPERIASSAGLLRTFTYLGAIGSSAATGAFFGHSADTHGLHELAAFMLVAAAVLVVITVADRSLRMVGRPAETVSFAAMVSAEGGSDD
ncbi:MAG TPA: MFS transporter [Jatrophihabitans sp.]|nr:MFS transporter [Jatrophihabitans sp.]